MTIFKFIRQYALRIYLTTIFLVSTVYLVEARPGGGHSSHFFSKSSDGNSASIRYNHVFGSRETDTIVFILLLIVGVIVAIFLLKERLKAKSDAGQNNDDSVGNSDGRFVLSRSAAMRVEELLEELRKNDPNFSKILFLDFVQSVVYEYFKIKGTADALHLKPFFEVSKYIATDDGIQYSEIVINAMRIIRGRLAQHKQGIDLLTVALDLNYTMTGSGKRARYYSEQQWTFVRKNSVTSLPPEKMQLIACPSCGAPNSFSDGEHCDACGTHVEPAIQQWAVKSIANSYTVGVASSGLVEYATESGTDLPTIVQNNLPVHKAQFAQTHGLGDFNSYWSDFVQNVVEPSFKTIYDAWATKRWDRARHLVSDHFYQTQNFWIEEYKRNNYTNRLDDVQIDNVQLAHMEADKFYETFTVRIFASCLDYTQDSNGAVIGGSRTTPRKFSEYWTFVRRVGVEHQQHDWIDMDNCPACSAPLDKMGMSGVCGYCGHKITSGEFSWVLSRITQDEVYA